MTNVPVTDAGRELLVNARGIYFNSTDYVTRLDAFKAIARARAEEREACIRVAEAEYECEMSCCYSIAKAIRARGEGGAK